MSELDDLMPTSPDHNAARLAELKRLFPDLFSDEGQLDVKAVRKLADPDMLDMEKFRFTWYGKSRARRKAFSPSKGALVYDAERSVNPELADGNMIIEGENLEVLKLLTSAYSEKVKCIYIDPPYNTGNDFIYPDNYAQGKKEYWEQNGIFKDGMKMDSNPESNGRFHSDWLSMMFSRLLVARQLLKEDGVIFASIDDNEVHNLRKLMDEVFGEENFVGQITIKSNPRGSQSPSNMAIVHEYLLIFAKQIDVLPKLGIALTSKMREEYKYIDNDGRKYRLLGLRQRGGAWRREERPSLFFPIYVNPKDSTLALEKLNDDYIPVNPIKPTTNQEGSWRWSKKKILGAMQHLIPQKIKRGKSIEWDIYQKDYLNDKSGNERMTKAKTIWDESELNYQNGTTEVKRIFETTQTLVDYPKPKTLISKVISMANVNSGDIILDFFAGSGTAAHAVIESNISHGEGRKFILVQLPESIDQKLDAYRVGYRKISDITIERVRRVVAGYGDNPKPLNTGFKVYRLAESRFPRVTFQPNPDKSTEENVAALKQYIIEKEASMYMTFERDAVFDEVLLKHGFPLNYTLEKQGIFAHNDVFLARTPEREMLICLDTFLQEETVAHFKTNRDPFFLCLERGLNTDKKWALKHYLGERLKTI